MSRQLALRRDPFPGVRAVPRPVPRRGWRDRPGLVLLAGSIATAILVGLELVGVGGKNSAVVGLHVVVSAGASTIALAILARRPEAGMLRYRPLAVAIGMTGAGMIILNVAAPTIGVTPAVVTTNALFIGGSVLSMGVIVPSLYRRLDSRALVMAALDGGIMLVAGTALMLVLLGTNKGAGGIGQLVVPVAAATLLASGGVAAVVALALRVAPSLRGVWCGIVAVVITGVSWIIWIDTVLRGQYRDTLSSLLYSIGVLMVSYAWMTWNEDIGGGKTYDRIARLLVDWLPITAILLCVVVAAVPHERIQGIDPALVGTAIVVLLSISRQRLLIVRERWASRRLAGEVEERAQTMLSLARLEQAESLEATASRICDEALRLDGIDAACVYAFAPSGAVVPLALDGACRPDENVGEPIDQDRAMHVRACAGQGTWVDSADLSGCQLVGEAFAPMRWDDRTIGVVAMGTTDLADAQRLTERLPTLTEFGVVSAALIGPLLTEHWRMAEVREQLERVIGEHAFTPVFQPVVRLHDGAIVGYEALTRFSDDARPDKRFIEADAAGMSVRLEMACLGDQLEAATWLPAGPWVSLNISPALASAVVPLISALERADRDVVLEITEHVEIADYRKLVGALDIVRDRARIAVDDAGAGYAGLRHILELRAHFVKLDLSLVRNIDSDPARQAMVAGMAHFAANSGCELIAEGIETSEELGELIRLGIAFGQGYLFGRPAPIG